MKSMWRTKQLRGAIFREHPTNLRGAAAVLYFGPMSDDPSLPDPNSLQSVIGALLFASDRPLSVDDLRATLRQGPLEAFAQTSPRQIQGYLADIAATLARSDLGLRLCEEDGRFSLRTVPEAAPWVRALTKAAPPQRLSRAGLETLAIIAYRQPISRAEIESVRGVSADHTIRALMELNLIRTVGRSELPGRPFLYGTTTTFLEHFGLRSLEELIASDGRSADGAADLGL